MTAPTLTTYQRGNRDGVLSAAALDAEAAALTATAKAEDARDPHGRIRPWYMPSAKAVAAHALRDIAATLRAGLAQALPDDPETP